MELQSWGRIRGIGSRFALAKLTIAALGSLGLALAITAMVIPNPAAAEASGVPGLDPLGSKQAARPTATESETQACAEVIWTSRLVAGRDADTIQSYTGYLSVSSPPLGELSNTGFTLNGVNYEILALFEHEFGIDLHQVVIGADNPLPDQLILQIRDLRLPVKHGQDVDSQQNMQGWYVESPLHWAVGETVQVSLLRAPYPEHEGILFFENSREIMRTASEIPGEVTRSGQYRAVPVTLEGGISYIVEMKGSATGDGNLSDPVISGVNGKFAVDGETRWEPVWYDTLGRTSTWVDFAGGTRYWVDENGRMFASITRADGSTRLPPVTGGNDDAGEGLNSRLYLQNFPGGEYQLMVSGAPNPDDTGTYAIVLKELVFDDNAAEPDRAGAVQAGESIVGCIEVPGDVDWFAVKLQENLSYRFHVRGKRAGFGTLANPKFAGVFDSEGNPIGDTSNNGGFLGADGRPVLVFIPEITGTYYIAVSGDTTYVPHRSDAPVGVYTLSVEVPEVPEN